MKDIFKKYHHHKIASNINIILASLVLAIWINIFLIDWTDIWNSLKTSVLNSNFSEQKSDIYLINENTKLVIKSNKNIKSLTDLSLSITYNPDNLELSEINSSIWDVINLSNTPWINTILITSKNGINISKWDNLLNITAIKKSNKSENLNIINANFKDNKNEQFLLSTSGITF